MGASCQCQQQGSDTYQNQETQWHIPISKEFRPKPINTSIKHDLRANYQDLDCQYCNRPQMREMGAQTHVTFCNISQCDTQKKKNKNQKKQKPKKCKDKASFENSESSKQRSSSQYSQTQNILLLYQSLKSQGRQYQQQKAKPYEVLVNSQKVQPSLVEQL
ncbi:unnamed protein product (macronuclear) [Paramecium tetraurelia]|uniref:Uncharacterized protein n=1 Tax=Paramecium tetraurelia TaxID=5888 RepID=A0E6H1_PARTE|nr:uncharacterized protein GSPATT00003753001 [Paramecium tetraurelia]CAK90888.1 unnamed protein product [Paramecium tetraurelia]|eukprot:XP_001458285.1 hypothetical protein (macronuclear) [Paramecium tetraurelia strain d4-2]